MRYLYIIFLSTLTSVSAFAQGSMFGMSYQAALPIGPTSDFINTFSGRGFGIDYKGFVNNNVTVGGSVGWNVFYQAESNQTYPINEGNSAITGDQWKYINSFPILVNADYFLGTYGEPRIFFGAGIGAFRIYQRIDMGLYTYEPREWAFGFAPEAGVTVPMNRDAYFMGSIRFNYALPSGDIEDPTSYIGFNLGFAWN